MNSRPCARLAGAGAAKLVTTGVAGPSGGLKTVAADTDQHRRATRKVDLDTDLLSIAAAGCHQLASAAFQPEDIGGEAETALCGESGGIPKGIDAMCQQHDRRTARTDQGAHGGLESVRIEFRRRRLHGDDFIDARNAERAREPAGIRCEDGDGNAVPVTLAGLAPP